MTTGNTTASPDLTEAELLAHIGCYPDRLREIVVNLGHRAIYADNLLNGRMPMTAQVANALGFERVTLYRRKQEVTDG